MAPRLRRCRPQSRGNDCRGSRLQLPDGRGRDDDDAALAGDCAGCAAQTQHVGARHLRLDPDRGRLSQGQPICRRGRRPRRHRSDARPVAAAGRTRRDHLLDVPHSCRQAGRAADRSARMVLRRHHQARPQHDAQTPRYLDRGRRLINPSFFPSRKLALYMVRLFVTRSLAVLVALVLILMTLDLLGESGKILAVPGNGDAELWRYVGLRIPLLLSRFLPFSVLLGTLIAFVGLNQHSEVVAMKPPGLSAHQILAPLVVASIGVAAALFAFNGGGVVNSPRRVTAWTDND